MSSFQLFKLRVLESVAAAHTDTELRSTLDRLFNPAPEEIEKLEAKVEAGGVGIATRGPEKSSAIPSPQTGDGRVDVALNKFRASLKEHGARGIFGLARKFKIIDDDGNGQLNMEEFKKAVNEHTLDMTPNDVTAMFNWFDKDGDGGIRYDEFLTGVRGQLNERRKTLVNKAFDVFDADHNGVIDMSDIVGRYNCDNHPDVLSGRKTKGEVFKEFLDVSKICFVQHLKFIYMY